MSEYEREDMELAAVMGGRFHDETNEHGAEPSTTHEHKPKFANPMQNTAGKEKPCEPLWKPVKPAPNSMDKLKAVAKEVGLYGALSTILFYWQQTGKLDYTTAWYALLVCVGMVFFSVGKNWRGGMN